MNSVCRIAGNEFDLRQRDAHTHRNRFASDLTKNTKLSMTLLCGKSSRLIAGCVARNFVRASNKQKLTERVERTKACVSKQAITLVAAFARHSFGVS